MTDQVDILLATYQGAPYIQEQIQSILDQTYPHWHLWLRDDGSHDQTMHLVKKLAAQYPSRITLLSHSQSNLGAKGNFSMLMQSAKAPYIMFADQDDKWLPNKIELSLNALKKLEKMHGGQTPLLVHTDLKVVRSDLSDIHPSLWQYTHLNPQATSLNRILAQNILTGCTALMNKKLLDLAQPIPSEAIMHDWWIALVAAAFGQIQSIPFPTILYRQHSSNDIGAKAYGWRSLFTKTSTKKKSGYHQTYLQAQVFLERYSSLLKSSDKTTVQAYVMLPKLAFFQRKKQVLKYRFFKHGFLRNLKAFLFQ